MLRIKHHILSWLALFCMALPEIGAAQDELFHRWLEDFRQEAEATGIPSDTLEKALHGLEYLPEVLELDRKQPESTLTLDEYLAKVVTPEKVERGRELMRTHRRLLGRIAQRYGVQPRFIVALWGVESNYGRNMGRYPVIAALATLAYDGRRSDFFRAELLNALKILQAGHIDLERMKGSWAGAMGQCQFMPSSFLRFAADGNGDGRRDIWSQESDVFASTANYLSEFDWDDSQTWGREVSLPAGFDENLTDSLGEKPVSAWQAMGFRRPDGAALPPSSVSARLRLVDNPGGRAYLIYPNYQVLLKWNKSDYFAVAVGMLADRLGGG